MKTVLVTGVCVIDFIFQLDEIPKTFEKFRANDAFITGGGPAANAAVAVSRLGGSATLASRLGEDEVAKLIMSDLVNEGINTKYIKQFEGHRSPFASAYIDKKGERQIVVYRDHTIPLDASWINEIEDHDVYLADTRWNEGTIETLKIAKKLNRPGVLDAEDTVTVEAIQNASHIAFSLFGLQSFTNKKNIKDALKEISMITKGWACVTNGEKGVYFLSNSELVNIPTVKIDAKDTLGAGDVWHGAFALSLAEGSNEIEAVKFANSAASLKCSVFGGRKGIPFRQELENFIKETQ